MNGEEGLYYCFGCGAKGDAITFVREIEHLDLAGAVERLAGRAGITLRYTTQGEGEGRSRKKTLVDAMEAVVVWYHERLLSSPDAAEARKYLRGRGLDGEIVRRYRIGWAPDDWDLLVRNLGVGFDRLEAVNLAMLNKRNRRQDVFRNQILFPISTASGDPVAFGGRVLPGGKEPKYGTTSRETPICTKSKVLLRLNSAKGAVAAANRPKRSSTRATRHVNRHRRASAWVRRWPSWHLADRGARPPADPLRQAHRPRLRRRRRGGQRRGHFYAWEGEYKVDDVSRIRYGPDPGDLAQNDPDALRRSTRSRCRSCASGFNRALASRTSTSPRARPGPPDTCCR